MSTRITQIDSLTGLRFIAAFTIAFGHFNTHANIKFFGIPLQTTIIGMPLFFTLSGFIIHYVYSESFLSSARKAIIPFFIARFSRLYPLFFFLFVYYAFFSPLGEAIQNNHNIKSIIAYLTLTSSWWYFRLNGSSIIQFAYGWSWSISTECFFYVCYALFLFPIGRIRSIRLCAGLLMALCISTYILMYYIVDTQPQWEAAVIAHHPGFITKNADFSNSFYRWLFYVSPYAHLPEFIGGCLTCQLFLLMQRQSFRISSLWLNRMSSIAALGIIGLLVWFSRTAVTGCQSTMSCYIMQMHMNFLFAPLCYLMMFSLASGESVIGKLLALPAFVMLGELSYSIYLAHPIVGIFAYTASPSISKLLMAFAMTLVLSYGLYHVIEMPGKRFLRRLYRIPNTERLTYLKKMFRRKPASAV